jgi:hypothetical protein
VHASGVARWHVMTPTLAPLTFVFLVGAVTTNPRKGDVKMATPAPSTTRVRRDFARQDLPHHVMMAIPVQTRHAKMAIVSLPPITPPAMMATPAPQVIPAKVVDV